MRATTGTPSSLSSSSSSSSLSSQRSSPVPPPPLPPLPQSSCPTTSAPPTPTPISMSTSGTRSWNDRIPVSPTCSIRSFSTIPTPPATTISGAKMSALTTPTVGQRQRNNNPSSSSITGDGSGRTGVVTTPPTSTISTTVQTSRWQERHTGMSSIHNNNSSSSSSSSGSSSSCSNNSSSSNNNINNNLPSRPASSASSNSSTNNINSSSISGNINNSNNNINNINNNIVSSSNISGSSGNNTIARVHGHDHTRPLPPPRLFETTNVSTIAPLTAPLTPLSTSSSFRTTSRLPLTSSFNDSTTLSTSRNDSSTRSIGEVTLTVPRPDGERIVNEYVETPFRQPTTATSNQKCLKNERRHRHHHNHHHHHQHRQQQLQQQHQHQLQLLQQQHQQQQQQQQLQQQQSSFQLQQQSKQVDGTRSSSRRHQSHLLQSSLPTNQAITKQPVSFTKEPSSNPLGSGSLAIGRSINDTSLSIMCDYCGKCRCESCREPPPLPSKWLCDNSCFCSAETALDYASCLCCVKGLFYHCADSGSVSGDSEIGGSCADEPCSCSGSRQTARWACLAALTMLLPCLLCYWPLKGCVAICESCYARHAAQGCRCDPATTGRHHIPMPNSRDSRDPEKRLLDPVTPDL